MSLYIYGTVLNNRNRIERNIKGISQLTDKKIVVVDNYSTDGTYEYLRSLPNIDVIQISFKNSCQNHYTV